MYIIDTALKYWELLDSVLCEGNVKSSKWRQRDLYYCVHYKGWKKWFLSGYEYDGVFYIRESISEYSVMFT